MNAMMTTTTTTTEAEVTHPETTTTTNTSVVRGNNVELSGNTTMAAQALTFLLTGWNKYGLVERSMYHLDLMSSLILPPQETASSFSALNNQNNSEKEKLEDEVMLASSQQQHRRRRSSVKKVDVEVMVQKNFQFQSSSDGIQNQALPSSCGVTKILECIPVLSVSNTSSSFQSRLSKKARRKLRKRLIAFNQQADENYYMHMNIGAVSNVDDDDNRERNNKDKVYSRIYEPKDSIPLKVTPGTRVSFCYDVARIVICVDASPALTSSLLTTRPIRNNSRDFTCCCPIDNLGEMIMIFMKAIIAPVETSGQNGVFFPDILVSVIAVYSITSESNLLSENEQVPVNNDVSILVKSFQVENEQSADILGAKVSEWARGELESGISSRLSQSVLEPMRHPNTIVANSSMSKVLAACEETLRMMPPEARPIVIVATACSIECESVTLNDPIWRDVPIHIFDLSPSTKKDYDPFFTPIQILHNLQISCYKEALYQLCDSKSGRVFDLSLLSEAAEVVAGRVAPDSRFYSDPFLASKRRSMYANALQWYVLFSISPLTPMSGLGSGRSTSLIKKGQYGYGDELSQSQYSTK